MMHNEIIKYGAVPVNSLFVQIACEEKKNKPCDCIC